MRADLDAAHEVYHNSYLQYQEDSDAAESQYHKELEAINKERERNHPSSEPTASSTPMIESSDITGPMPDAALTVDQKLVQSVVSVAIIIFPPWAIYPPAFDHRENVRNALARSRL